MLGLLDRATKLRSPQGENGEHWTRDSNRRLPDKAVVSNKDVGSAKEPYGWGASEIANWCHCIYRRMRFPLPAMLADVRARSISSF